MHDQGDACNAGYSPGTTDLVFGDANGCSGLYDFAREDKVIYHEYTHAVTYHLNSGILSLNNEEGAISEGTADYFAGSYADYRTTIGDWSFPGLIRDMADPEIDSYSAYQSHEDYPNVEAHDGGEFFSAVLWDLRNDPGISASQADWLVHAALDRVDGTPTFMEFRTAMIAEDQDTYGEAHRCAIEDVFADWGIGSECAPPDPPTNVAVSGDLGEYPLVTWTASAGASLYKIYRCSNTVYTCSPYALIGSTSTTLYIDYAKEIADQCSYSGWINDVTHYYVTAVNYAGESDPSNSDDICTEAEKRGLAEEERPPETFALHGNYPNPFNPSTEIQFDVPEATHVRLAVYDVMGREVAVLIDGPMEAGFQRVTWDAENLPSGVYLYRLDADSFSASRRMVLMK